MDRTLPRSIWCHKTVKPEVKYLLFGVLTMILATVPPAIALSFVDWRTVAGVAYLGSLAAYLAASIANWRVGLWLALPLAVASGLAVQFAHNPWLAAILLAIWAGARGFSDAWGLSGALTLAVISVGFIVAAPPTPHSSISNALFVGLIILAVALWATLIACLMKKHNMPAQPPKPLDRKRAYGFGVTLGVLVGIATWFIVDLKLGHPGGWIILTLVIVLQPYARDGVTKGVQRSAGTILGFFVAAGIASLIKSPGILLAIGMVVMVIAMVPMLTGKPYWQFAFGLTVAVVLFSGADASVQTADYERLGATLIGVLAAIIVSLISIPFSKAYSEKIGDAKF